MRSKHYLKLLNVLLKESEIYLITIAANTKKTPNIKREWFLFRAKLKSRGYLDKYIRFTHKTHLHLLIFKNIESNTLKECLLKDAIVFKEKFDKDSKSGLCRFKKVFNYIAFMKDSRLSSSRGLLNYYDVIKPKGVKGEFDKYPGIKMRMPSQNSRVYMP